MSKSNIRSRRGSAQIATLKFHLTCPSEDEHSLERIHTFNLKAATSFDGKVKSNRSKMDSVLPGPNVTTH
jgi:hypothetical protein